MIITEQKLFKTILENLNSDKKIFLVGCDDCAAQCQTGGAKEVDAMKEMLQNVGREVVGSCVFPVLCHELNTKRGLREHKEAIALADSVLVLACGSGIQAVTEAVECPIIPGCDSMYLGNIKRRMHFSQKCSICGECTLHRYGGICVTTRCSKGLLNGPCGGARNGKCEVSKDIECVWIKVFEKLEKQNRTEKIEKNYPAKDFNK